MKNMLYILFLLLSQTLIGQTIYEPVFINQCTNQVERDVYWYLTDSNKAFGLENLESKPISLPKPGVYNLYINLDNKPIEVEIIENKVNIDTIYLKRLVLSTFVSNPPHSEYLDCGALANGKITDFYSNGKIRTQGSFKMGQPADTLFEYHRNGNLAGIFIQKKKNWKSIRYFKNGEIEAVVDTKKRYEKVYFENRQLKIEVFWSKKNDSKTIAYFENGNVRKASNKRALYIYNQNGVLIEKLRRKEILVFERVFARNSFDRHHKFYEYNWETFDSSGTIKRAIIFNSHGFLMSAFPDSLNQIEDFLFNKVMFYKNGKESKMIEFKYLFENNESVKKMYFLRKEEDVWIEENITSVIDVYKTIADYSE